MALPYSTAMSTVALVIGLIVGNLPQPGGYLEMTAQGFKAATAAAEGEGSQFATEFRLGIMPDHARVAPLSGVRPPDPVRGAFRRVSPCKDRIDFAPDRLRRPISAKVWGRRGDGAGDLATPRTGRSRSWS